MLTSMLALRARGASKGDVLGARGFISLKMDTQH